MLFDLGSLGFGHLATQHARRLSTPPRALFAVCGLLAMTLPMSLIVPGPWPLAVFAGVALAGVAGLFAIKMSITLVVLSYRIKFMGQIRKPVPMH